jgi:hypothetical protein
VIWDARKLSDRTYHRRRLILFIISGLLGLGLVTLRGMDIAAGQTKTSDLASVAVWLGLVAYAALMGTREFRAMHGQSERR